MARSPCLTTHHSLLTWFIEQTPQLRPHRRCDVVARERIGHVGREKTDLRAAIEAAALEFKRMERLRVGKLDHRVGDLNFTPGSTLFLSQNVKDLGLKNITPGDDEI